MLERPSVHPLQQSHKRQLALAGGRLEAERHREGGQGGGHVEGRLSPGGGSNLSAALKVVRGFIFGTCRGAACA